MLAQESMDCLYVLWMFIGFGVLIYPEMFSRWLGLMLENQYENCHFLGVQKNG